MNLSDSQMALGEKLALYEKGGYIPFHMPGHKRQTGDPDLNPGLPWGLDITEIEGFDNLHHPEGILKNAMDYASSYYGSKASVFSVNGSSGAVLAAICGVTNHGDEILIARNSHKSVYHGVLLRGLKPVYVYPQIDRETGIACGYSPEEVEEQLKNHPSCRAVLITSPTYEGVVSDIQRIEKICHRRRIPLIVDEAHGAHFSCQKEEKSYFPLSALTLGADLVIQSLHKTLPSLTQTAILHVGGDLVEVEKIRFFMGVFQTSSPSYILMNSIDSCIRFLASERGEKRRLLYEERLRKFRRRLKQVKGFRILLEEKGDWICDPSKIPLQCRFLTGKELYERLLEEYRIQCEMYTEKFVLLMTSMFDTEEMEEALLHACEEISEKTLQGKGEGFSEKRKKETGILIPRAEQRLTPGEAFEREGESISLAASQGRVSREYAYQYPPGIPILVPGERIDSAMVAYLCHGQEIGIEIQGLQDLEGKKISVLKGNPE